MNPVTKIALQILGMVAIVFGVIGIFLPFLQGILFLIIGLAILSVTSPSFKARIDLYLESHPRTKAHFHKYHQKLSKFFGQSTKGK